MSNDSKGLEPTSAPHKFLIETLVGVAIFLIIAITAVILSYIVTYLDDRGVDKVIIYGLKAAEYLLFIVDLILFCRFLWRTAKKTWSEL